MRMFVVVSRPTPANFGREAERGGWCPARVAQTSSSRQCSITLPFPGPRRPPPFPLHQPHPASSAQGSHQGLHTSLSLLPLPPRMDTSRPSGRRATTELSSMEDIALPAPTHPSHHHHHHHHTVNGRDASPASSLPSTGAQAEPAFAQRRDVPNLTTEAQEERLFLQGDFAPRKKPRRRTHRGAEGASPASIKEKPLRRRSRRRRADPHPDTATQAARGIRERVLHFTPSWFAVTMGTGVIATLVNLLPWTATHSGFRWVALVYLLADIVM